MIKSKHWTKRFLVMLAGLSVAGLTLFYCDSLKFSNDLQSCEVHISEENIISFTNLRIDTEQLDLSCLRGKFVPILCDTGVTGAFLIGDGSFTYTLPNDPKPVQDTFYAAMLRFNPGEFDSLKTLFRTVSKDTDIGAAELSRHLLDNVIDHCSWKRGKEVYIPRPQNFFTVLYSKSQGDLVIWMQRGLIRVVHSFTENKEIYSLE